MKSVLITGATGFAGRHLIEQLYGRDRIIALSHGAVVPDDSSVTYESTDIADPDVLRDVILEYKPDRIVHLASKTHDWFGDPQLTFKTNALGTMNLYEAVLNVRNHLPHYDPKILYVSSSEVYGKADNPRSIREDSLLRPANHYSASKASAELISHDYSRSHGLNIVIARPFTHTGPGQSIHGFASSMASQIARLEAEGGGTLRVGNLDAIRDYSDVRDIVQAYELLLNLDVPSGSIFNVCSGHGVKVKDVLDELVSMSTAEISIELDPSRIRPSDTPIFIGDATKLEAAGWTAQIPISKTLADLLEYWRARTT